MSDSADELQPTAYRRTDHVPLGILLMLGATVLYACSTAISKWQVTHYPFAEVLFIRSAVSLITCGVADPAVDGPCRVPHQSPARSRGARRCADRGAELHPHCAQPDADRRRHGDQFFGTALCHAVCGAVAEGKSGRGARGGAARRLCRRAAGRFPGADSFRVGALFAIANAILYGSVTAAVRGMSVTETPQTLTMYQMLFMTCFFAVGLAIFGVILPTGEDALAMIAGGVCNGVGQYWWTRSLSLAPPAAVGPFYYFTLVWAMILGFAFWGDVPAATLLAGSAIVAGSGLFLLWREAGKMPLSSRAGSSPRPQP